MPVRIQRKRIKGWRMPEGAVYVGRPTKWGNPFPVGSKAYGGFQIPPRPDGPELILGSDRSVEIYQLWLLAEVVAGRLDPRELRGKDLVCWCGEGKPCHADVLLELANAR